VAHLYTREYWESEASGDDKGTRTWTRVFKVVYDSIEQPATVLDAAGIPLRWEAHPLDAAMLAKTAKSAHLDGDPYCWLVTVEYSSLTGDESRGADDPRARPLEMETDFMSFNVPMLYDNNGKAILNSANDRMDPPWEMEDSRPVLRFSRYETSLDLARSLAFRNAVNLDTFYGFADGELMCMYIKQKRHFENGIECWHTQYEFQGKANGTVVSNSVAKSYKGWDAVIPDMGFNEIVSGVKTAIFTKSVNGKVSKAVSKEVRLNGAGVALSDTATLEATFFHVFRPPYRYQNFSILGLV
jgi:hypothetical protein